MDKETVEQKIAKFHAHLDICYQCEHHPFNLCPTGAKLLKDAATDGEKPASQSPEIPGGD